MSSSELSEDELHTSSQINLSIQGKQIIQATEAKTVRCVGGTQIIQTQKRRKRNLRERWREEVFLNIKDKTWTSACAAVNQHLQNSSVAVVIGSPGEGKTTLAHLILHDFKQYHWKIAIPQTPKEYFNLKQRGRMIFLFSDIFGVFEFDDNSIKTWCHVFEDLRNRLDKQFSENPDGDHPSLKIIFVQRDYIWREVEPKVGKYVNSLFKKEHIWNLSSPRTLTEDDKLQLIHTYQEKYKRTLTTKCIQELIAADTPHGFPHCAELLFILPGGLEKSVDFLNNPISFLNETIRLFCQDEVKRLVFSILLKNGGSVQLKVINSKKLLEEELKSIDLLGSSPLSTEKFQQLRNGFKNFGSYLQFDNKDVQFSHASILQSVALCIGEVDPEYLIRNCDLLLLKNILKSKPSEERRASKTGPIFTEEGFMNLIVERFFSELHKGRVLDVLSSSLFEDEVFVTCFFDHLPKTMNLLKIKDISTGRTCFYLASQSGKNVFLKELLDRFQMNSRYLQEAVFGCCEYGNIKGLIILLRTKDCTSVLGERNEERETPLLCAARSGRTEICKLLLRHGAHVSDQDKDGNTALHFAADGGNVDLVQHLVEILRTLNIRNNKKQTALHLALLGGHPETSQLLLDHGADYTLQEKMGLSALHCASFTGLTEIVKHLIQKGADINMMNKRGSPAIIKAAEGGHDKVVEILHENGSDVKQANFKGYTALHMASQNGHVKVVQLLIQLGCDINRQSKSGFTGLMLASAFGRQDVVEVLIHSDCVLDIGDAIGRTAIWHAVMASNTDIAFLLLDNGCRVNVLLHLSAKVLMAMICDAMEGMSLMRIMLRSVSSVCWVFDSGFAELQIWPVLYAALLTCQLPLVVRLLDQDNLRNDLVDAYPPVHMFCQMIFISKFSPYIHKIMDIRTPAINPSNFAPIANELFNRGADVDEKDDDGATALHLAASVGCVELMNVLLGAGCNLDTKDNNGQTPLHYASWNGQVEGVKWLLENNCDPHLYDRYNHTALHYAILNKQHVVADLLKSEGCRVYMPISLLYSIPYVSVVRHVCKIPLMAYVIPVGLWLGTKYWSNVYDSITFW